MASETGATPEQIERAWKRRQQRWSEEGLDALAGSNIIAKQLLGNTASDLVRPDERIVSVSDLEAVCKAARHEVDRLYEDGCRVCIQKADALGAIIERLCEVIGGPQ